MTLAMHLLLIFPGGHVLTVIREHAHQI